jgi:hypothetical protein
LFRSGEIRWFFPDTEPNAETRLVASGPLAEKQAERVDRYLLLPDCATVGVKFRGGNFEIKAQVTAPERVSYGPDIAGFRSTWVKWSHAAANLLDAQGPASGDETWVCVRKRRTIRLLSLESGTPAEVPVGGPWLEAGCQVERTGIDVLAGRGAGDAPPGHDWEAAQSWWSVSFESFGAPDRLLHNLDTAVSHVIATQPGLRLGAAASMSYPEWLLSLRP